MEDKRKEIVGNVIRIQRYHSPCGDLMLGSFEDRLCLCDWAVESHRDIIAGCAALAEALADKLRFDAVKPQSYSLDERRLLGVITL